MRFDDESRVGASPIYVNTPTKSALLFDIEQRLSETRGFSVATLNLDHVVKLRSDKSFASAYRKHSHVVADGNPIVWLSAIAGRGLELIPGSDLIWPLMDLSEQLNIPVAFLGATESTLRMAKDKVVSRNPKLRVVALVSPSYGFEPTGDEADKCIDQLRESGARLVLVALGAPRQEIFVARASDVMAGCGFVSVGAALDFAAGTQRRAPIIMRRLAMEWLWRLFSDWRRLSSRYAACIRILPALTFSALKQRTRGGVLTEPSPPPKADT